MNPGPGHYQMTPTMTGRGTYFVSKFRSSMCRTFGNEKRGSCTDRDARVMTPGPGAYCFASDFFMNPSRAALFMKPGKRVRLLISTPFNLAGENKDSTLADSPARKSTPNNGRTKSAQMFASSSAANIGRNVPPKNLLSQGKSAATYAAIPKK